jgi:hypothetical protein
MEDMKEEEMYRKFGKMKDKKRKNGRIKKKIGKE